MDGEVLLPLSLPTGVCSEQAIPSFLGYQKEMDFLQSPGQKSFMSGLSSPDKSRNGNGNGKDWVANEEPFEAEETEFVCEGDQNPIQPDRSSELAVESWNLKKTVMDLNSQMLKLKSELRTQKNLTKNLQKINQSIQQENKDRAKDNIHLRSQVASLEKQTRDLTQQNGTITTNVTRNKRVANQLQGKINEMVSHHNQQIKERDTIIQQGKGTIVQLQDELRAEKERSEQQIRRLEEEKDHLVSVVHTLTKKTEELQEENEHLKIDLQKAREQCTDAARFLNKELEKAFESMHTKLEKVIAKKDEYRMLIFEKDFERDQILAYMLSEGLQMPHLAPLNVAQARERIRMENLSYDDV